MATLLVSEYARIGLADGARTPAPEVPALSAQKVTFTTTARVAVAFQSGTRVVAITAAGAAAYIKFGGSTVVAAVSSPGLWDDIVPDGVTRVFVLNDKAGITHVAAYDGSS